MLWPEPRKAGSACTSVVQRLLSVGALACCLGAGLVPAARADDDPPKPAPRTAVTIGGASVVLVATNEQLYAFVDRIADNAPVEDAELSIETDEGVAIPMTKARLGLNGANAMVLVGPLKRPGRMQDAFMVTLHSSAGSGDAPAEITYSDVQVERGAVPVAGTRTTTKIAVAFAAAGFGAVGVVLIMTWRPGTGRRRRVGQRA